MIPSAQFRQLVAVGASVLLVAGCASSAPRAAQTDPIPAVDAQRAPAGPGLTACVNPKPVAPKPIDTAIARDFAAQRLRSPLSLDHATFRAVPAAVGARPRISASVAFCNLLAGMTAQNFGILQAAAAHGLSFGLGVVSISDSVLKSGPRSYLVGTAERIVDLHAYHSRLAWLAVVRPDVVVPCPSGPARASPPPLPRKTLPGYQVLALDADNGSDAIVYTAKTNALCNPTRYQAASVSPAVEVVSVPWTVVRRGPGPKSATISYQHRSCDVPFDTTFGRNGPPAVFTDDNRPGLVDVTVERVLTTCGPAVSATILLRSSTLATDLPPHLIHAPVGAQDRPTF